MNHSLYHRETAAAKNERRRKQLQRQSKSQSPASGRTKKELEQARTKLYVRGAHEQRVRSASALSHRNNLHSARTGARPNSMLEQRDMHSKRSQRTPDFREVALQKPQSVDQPAQPPPPFEKMSLLGQGGGDQNEFPTEVDGRYELLRHLGRGSFGSVSLVRCEGDSKLYAMKAVQYAKGSSAKRQAAHEVNMLKAIDHPNIVNFRDAFLSKNGRLLCIVTAYCDSGTLDAVIKQRYQQHLQQHKELKEQPGGDSSRVPSSSRSCYLPQEQILSWFVQVALALHYMHHKHCLHRDLKPANIFLSQSRTLIKIGDFGLSKLLDDTQQMCQTEVGTPQYTSPEVLSNKPYSFPADVWSLGCVLAEMMALKPPFQGNTLVALGMSVMRAEKPPLPDDYCAELKDLVYAMLDKDPAHRPEVGQVLQARFTALQRHKRQFVEKYKPRDTMERLRRAEQSKLKQQLAVIDQVPVPERWQLHEEREKKREEEQQQQVEAMRAELLTHKPVKPKGKEEEPRGCGNTNTNAASTSTSTSAGSSALDRAKALKDAVDRGEANPQALALSRISEGGGEDEDQNENENGSGKDNTSRAS